MKHFNIFVLAASLAFASGTVSVQADVTRKEDVLNISSSKSVNNSENESDLEEILQSEMLHDRMLDKNVIDSVAADKGTEATRQPEKDYESYKEYKSTQESLEALEDSSEVAEDALEAETNEEESEEASTEEFEEESTEDSTEETIIAPTAAPIISSTYSQYSTGNITSQSSCITLTEEQIASILQSVGTVSDTRKTMLQAALQKVGRVPYVWGGGHSSYKEEPTGMDCSAFVNYILYHYVGIDLNGLNCAGMAAAFRSNAIPKSWVCSANDLVAGDIIIRLTGSTNHVVIYVGRNQYGLPMVIDEFGTDTVGNVMYQQKQIYYFEDGQSVFVHLDI